MEKMISVVIPICGDRTYLLRCLKAIQRQTYKATEIILVTDEYDEIYFDEKEQFQELQIIHISESLKYSGLNRAIRDARGMYIMFCSVQSVLAPNTLEQMIADVKTDSNTFTCATPYISSGKTFHSMKHMELSLYGKIFLKDKIIGNNIRLTDGFPLAEFLFVSQYLRSFQAIQTDEEIYIYESDTNPVKTEYDESVEIKYWDALFAAFSEMESSVRDSMLRTLEFYIKENHLSSFDIMFSAEKNAHSLYGLNYLLSGSRLAQVWTDISINSNGENLVPFREYLKCYETDDDYFNLLLSTCGLTKPIYKLLWNDQVDLLLIKEARRNAIGEAASKNDLLQLRNDFLDVKKSLSELNESVKRSKTEERLVTDSRETAVENQVTHILQIEDFIIKECREGRVGLKTVWNFGKACMSYKMKSKKK